MTRLSAAIGTDIVVQKRTKQFFHTILATEFTATAVIDPGALIPTKGLLAHSNEL